MNNHNLYFSQLTSYFCILFLQLGNYSFSGFDYKTLSLIMNLEKQSPDIAQGVHVERNEDDVGAGDQVLVLSMSYYRIIRTV